MNALKACLCLCLVMPALTVHAGYLHGSITTKLQMDNRQVFSRNGRQFAETFGDFYYDDKANDLNSGVLIGARYQDRKPHYELYRAFIRKGFDVINSEITLGRFERADNLGMYSIDGGNFRYLNKQFSVDFYAGRPRRIEDLKSEQGDSVFGTEAILKLNPEWRHTAIPLTIDKSFLRLGYQRFKFRNIAHRLEFGSQIQGRINAGDDSNYQLTGSGTYQISQHQFRDLLVEGLINVNKNLGIRGRYQRYNPKSNMLTFRERFFQFLTRDKQQLYEAGFQHQLRYDIKLYLNGMRVTRSGFDTGYGARAGFNLKHWPNLSLYGQFHYLELGAENAKSVYFGIRSTPTSKLSFHLRNVLRDEQKQLNGANRVVGGDLEVRYMIENNLIISLDGTYIWNSRRPGEYLGSVKIQYFFDYYKPKEAH